MDRSELSIRKMIKGKKNKEAKEIIPPRVSQNLILTLYQQGISQTGINIEVKI